jgi:hypothetical protein
VCVAPSCVRWASPGGFPPPEGRREHGAASPQRVSRTPAMVRWPENKASAEASQPATRLWSDLRAASHPLAFACGYPSLVGIVRRGHPAGLRSGQRLGVSSHAQPSMASWPRTLPTNLPSIQISHVSSPTRTEWGTTLNSTLPINLLQLMNHSFQQCGRRFVRTGLACDVQDHAFVGARRPRATSGFSTCLEGTGSTGAPPRRSIATAAVDSAATGFEPERRARLCNMIITVMASGHIAQPQRHVDSAPVP